MGEPNNYKIKIFLWDQFIRPIYILINLYNLQAIILAMIIINFITYKSLVAFWILIILALIISLFDIVKYWKSGEFIYNYRSYKYPGYRKIIKELKKSKAQQKISKLSNKEDKEKNETGN